MSNLNIFFWGRAKGQFLVSGGMIFLGGGDPPGPVGYLGTSMRPRDKGPKRRPDLRVLVMHRDKFFGRF
jgi:hypothetical protein